MTATLAGMSPQHRGLITDEDAERIRVALEARTAAEAEVRSAVLAAAAHGSSVRELAAFTGLSTNTISRWKRGE